MSRASRDFRPLQPAASHQVRSADDVSIAFDVYPAPPGRDPVLIVPGFWRDRRHPSVIHVATWFRANGFPVVVLDVRGHGESEGTYGFNRNEALDVAAVVEAASATYGFRRYVVVGFSTGGAIAATAIARHGVRAVALILISAVADFRILKPRLNPFELPRHLAFGQVARTPRFVWNVRRSEKIPGEEVIGECDVPLLVVHVRNDWLVGHEHAERYHARARDPKHLVILDIPGGWHADRIFLESPDTIEPPILEFLASTIPTESSSETEVPPRA